MMAARMPAPAVLDVQADDLVLPFSVEGLDVRGAYVHDLKAGVRADVAIDPEAIGAAEEIVTQAAVRLRNRDYRPNPGARCRRCEVRTVCAAAAT
jgi:DNA helicase II / ATP-dependent DNA helicase PcrA